MLTLIIFFQFFGEQPIVVPGFTPADVIAASLAPYRVTDFGDAQTAAALAAFPASADNSAANAAALALVPALPGDVEIEAALKPARFS